MAGSVYAASFDNVSVSASVDIWEINAPSTGSVIILSAAVFQLTDTTDATAEHLRLLWQFLGTSGSGGTSVTPALLNGKGTAASSVWRTVTTKATGETLLEAHGWNTLAGWYYNPAPEERIEIGASDELVLTLEAAPSGAINVSSFIRFMEITR